MIEDELAQRLDECLEEELGDLTKGIVARAEIRRFERAKESILLDYSQGLDFWGMNHQYQELRAIILDYRAGKLSKVLACSGLDGLKARADAYLKIRGFNADVEQEWWDKLMKQKDADFRDSQDALIKARLKAEDLLKKYSQ